MIVFYCYCCCFCICFSTYFIIAVKNIFEFNVDSKKVRGLATLDNRLYVGFADECGEIHVFDMKKNNFKRMPSVTIERLGVVSDMTSCSYSQCIYIADYGNKLIHKLDRNGSTIRWPVYDQLDGVSVNPSFNVLVTCDYLSKLKEFTPGGQLVREILLNEDIVRPLHAIQLTSDEFVVCHGGLSLSRVCAVNGAGESSKESGDSGGVKLGADVRERFTTPLRLVETSGFVFVVDFDRYRVVLLNSNLMFMKEVVSGLSYRPRRFCIDEMSGHIIVSGSGDHIYVYSVYDR